MVGPAPRFLVSLRSAARAAYVAAALNLAAALAMLLLLRSGLPEQGSAMADRMDFVRESTLVWRFGWLLWHAAAIALLGFYVGLAGQWFRESPILCTLALLCAGAGLAGDLAAEALYMAIAPGSTSVGFGWVEKVAAVLTGYLGNGLYTVAGTLLTIAGARSTDHALPKPLLALAAAVWVAGFGLSAATLSGSAPWMFRTTAALMPTFVIWTFLMGRWLAVRAERVEA